MNKTKVILLLVVLVIGLVSAYPVSAKGYGGCYLYQWSGNLVAFRFRNAPKNNSYIATYRLKDINTGRTYVMAASSWARMGTDVVMVTRYNFRKSNWKITNVSCIAGNKVSKNPGPWFYYGRR